MVKRKTMEDEEYDEVQKKFKKFKRSRFGKMILKELDIVLFRFYIEGYESNSHKHSNYIEGYESNSHKHSNTKSGDKKQWNQKKNF